MNDISCKAIADILPLYAENMVSDDTRALVDEHLAHCEHCRASLAALQAKPALPQDDGNMLKKLRRKLLFQKAKWGAVACLTVLILLSLWGTYQHAPISLSAAEAVLSVKPAEEDGLLSILMTPAVCDYRFDHSPDGTIFLTAWTTESYRNRGFRSYQEALIPIDYYGEVQPVTTITEPVSETASLLNEEIPCRLYYYSSAHKDGMDVLLYESKNMPKADYDGVQTMPRLVLNYYFVIAGLLAAGSALLTVILFIVRRRKSARLMMHVTIIPACYALSSMLVLRGRGDVYNVQYYFSAILFIAILMYIAVRFVMYLFTKPE